MTKQPSPRTLSSLSLYSPKISLFLLSTCVTLFILLQIRSLQNPPPSSPTSASWSFIQNHWQTSAPAANVDCTSKLNSMKAKLRRAVTFLPLKDLRYAAAALVGHTWFMSSILDTHEEGEVQYQKYPSASSGGRLLCLRGRDRHDGARNSYAFAWPDSLPDNATLVSGLTFVSYNHYNYDNIWHGLSAVMPFVGWHLKNGCARPNRWVLYHWGELRTHMGAWLSSLMEATFGGPVKIEGLEGYFEKENDDEKSVCFEEAVVMRHNEGGMSRERRMEVYDLMRCRARSYCKVRGGAGGDGRRRAAEIRMMLFMRTGPRSFRNETAVVGIFEEECRKVEGCQLVVAHSNNLTFCEQVKLMGSTDILVSPHGAQLTNMFLMDRNSSVMEFFPKGWLKLAGVGQFVYHWISSWSGMNHQGAWRDPHGDPCPYPETDRRCMSIFKSGLIGHNKTYFGDWVKQVLDEVKTRKTESMVDGRYGAPRSLCACR